MKHPSGSSFNRRRFRRLFVEPLEIRNLLTTSPANVIGVFEGTLEAGATRDIPIVLRTTPGDFTLSGGSTVLGVHVRAAGGSFDPNVALVRQGGTVVTPLFQNANLTGSMDSLTLVELVGATHTIQVRGQGSSAGAYRVEVFLAGDADGNGTVNAADGTLIRNVYGVRSPDPRYNASHDSNRDGIIEAFDLAQQRRNLSDATKVKPLAATVGLANDPVVLGDGRLLTNLAQGAVVGMATSTGVVAALETGTDNNFDNGSGIASAAGTFSIPFGLIEGDNSFGIRLRDGFGQEVILSRTAALDTLAPTFAGGASLPPSAAHIDLVYSEPMGAAAFVAANYALKVTGGTGVGNPINIASAEKLAEDRVRLHLAAPLDDGRAYEARATAIGDLARNGLAAPGNQLFLVAESFGVVSVNPAEGEELVSTTRSAIVTFTEKVDPLTVTSQSVRAIALGQTVPGNVTVSSTGLFATFYPDAPWPASTEIRFEIDGTLVKALDGDALDGDDDGLSGGAAAADFRTLPLTRIPNTNIYGYVYDSYHKDANGNNIPIVGATIRVDALPDATVTTDANGYFLLTNMPAPEFFVHIDGTTAINAPPGTVYPSVGKPFHTVPGQTVQLNHHGTTFDIYLPPMATGDIVDLSPTETTQVGFGDGGLAELSAMFPEVDPSIWERMQVSFAPGAAVDKDGNVATQATIIPVPPDRLPAPLPPNVDPQLVISIQALGATSFDVPAAVAFPNLEGLQPGEQALIWSFDHAAGHWIVIGTGTVTDDGTTITSDSGVGIRAPGWHFVISGTRNRFQIGTLSSGCGTGNDFRSQDDVATPPTYPALNADRIKRVQELEGKTDAELEQILRGVIAPGGSLATTVVDLFMNWGTITALPTNVSRESATSTGINGPTLRHDVGSQLSNSIKNSSDFKGGFFSDGVKQTVEKAVKSKIQTMADGGKIEVFPGKLDLGANEFPEVNYKPYPFSGDPSDLTYIIGGIQGRQLFIQNFDAKVTRIDKQNGIPGEGEFTAKLRYVFCDDFGVDENDIYTDWKSSFDGNGLVAQWILQHQRSAKPFMHEIIVEEEIKGTFTIPDQYETFEIHITGNGPLNVQDDDGLIGGLLPTGSEDLPGLGIDKTVHYRIVLNTNLQIVGRFNADGSLPEIVLPPNRNFSMTLYQPSTQGSRVLASVSSPSGQLTLFSDSHLSLGEVGSIIDLQVGGSPDTDGDGVPDIGEFAIGTKITSSDSDHDGISDAAEIAQGLNPLDGLAFPTGTISSLPLPGTAEKVTVDGNRLYVATGSHGLAIVDGTQFNNPILLGQIALSGYATEVDVDGALGIAAVASGSALHLVNVANGMTPVLLRTLTNVPATRVEVASGLAYALSGNALRVVDLITGNVIQSLTLPGSGTPTGFAREGTFLYAFLSGSDTFSVIDIANEGGAVVRGQRIVSVASSDVGLFVGNGIAWLAGSGLRTIDVSNPTNPTIIQTPIGSQFFTARRLALNGSGLGLLLPDGGNFLQVYRTSNPNNVADLLFQLPLSGDAMDVAISRGIAYVGAGDRLEVVNYLPFDNLGTSPNVTLTTTTLDADLIKPEVQLLEGTTLPLRVAVSDDVQVRNVELLLNGQVIDTDVAFPFDFFTSAPAIVGGVSAFTLQVRATDTGGNSSPSNLLMFELVNDTTAPTITHVEPPTGASRVEPLQTVQVRFSKPMDAATVSSQTIRVRDTAGNSYVPVNFQLRDNDRLAQLTFNPLAMGNYEIVVGGNVADRAGNRLLASGDFVSPFSLTLRGMVQTSIVDADAGTPGVQTYEGTTVPLSVTVVSGVTVQNVELIVNGVSLATDGTAPYEFSVVAPNIVPGASSLALQARVTDSSGISTLTNVLTIGLLEDITAPTIVSTTPANGGSGFENLTSLQVSFSEPLNSGSVALANFHLFQADSGGLFDGSETEVPLLGLTLENDDTLARLTTAPLPIGVYQLRMTRDGVTDRALNTLGTGTFISQFTLEEQLIVNGSFEEGSFTGWTLNPASGGNAQVVTQHLGFSAFDGARFALLIPGWVGQFTRLRQTFTVRTGDTVSGFAYFNAEDYLPFNDTGYVRILQGSTVVATVFSSNVAAVGNFGQTPWTPWSLTFSNAGTYTVEAGVANMGDSAVESYLGLEGVSLTRGSGTIPPPPGAPLMGTSRGAGAGALTLSAAQAAVSSAERLWEKALAVNVPSAVAMVADLPGDQLGEAEAQTGRLVLDVDAAGVGWFVDPTPFANEEFTAGAATSNSPAKGRYDLLTVALHELGHLLGFDHVFAEGLPGSLMNGSLGIGERRLPEEIDGEFFLPEGVSFAVNARAIPARLSGELGGLVQLSVALPTGTLRSSAPAAVAPERKEATTAPAILAPEGGQDLIASPLPIVRHAAERRETRVSITAFVPDEPEDEFEI